jgi:DNA-binding MarR family transcriptional regulator
LGGLENYLGFHLRRAQEASFSHFAALAGIDLDPGRYAVLKIIGSNENINQTALSAAIGRDISTLTVTLRYLLGAGFITRERAEHDRRNYALKLSAEGHAYLRALDDCARQHEEVLDRIVGLANKDHFLQLLDAIATELA